MKTITSLFLAAGLLTGLCATAQTTEETPIITFKTNIYDTYGATNAFHIIIGSDTETDYVDIDAGYGMIEAEIKPWYVDTENGGIAGGTAIPLNVSPEGIVKIYGDPKLVHYFEAEGCYLDWIDMDQCTNLMVLNLAHNELKRLDLSPFTNLFQIDIVDNTFTSASPVVIGKNHPDLTILEMGQTEWIDPDFNISDYPNLQSFSAYHSTLAWLDPSGCPKIQRIDIDMTNVSSLDVSTNSELKVLNIGNSRITDIDLSKNGKLLEFYADYGSSYINPGYQLNSIDLSNNPALTLARLNGNHFKTVDFSKNPQLCELFLKYNNITELNLEANPLIYNLDLSYTDMSFATLPFPTNIQGEGLFLSYYYVLNNIPVDRSIKVGTTLDFSDKILREGTTTTVALYCQNLNEITEDKGSYFLVDDESAYTYSDGKITLNKAFSDSLYVAFNNERFPSADYHTTPFMVKSAEDFGQPSTILTFKPSTTGQEVAMSIGIDGASDENPLKFFVDPGNGNRIEYTTTVSSIPAEPNITVTPTGTISIILPEGEVLSAFAIDGVALSSINLTAARELRELSITNASIRTIDISYNRNLRLLDLSNNKFASISFKGANDLFEKHLLSDVNLSHNNLKSFTIPSRGSIKNFDLSYNNFSEFESKDWDYIETFNISNNKLTELNLEYFTSARSINISNNNITTLSIPADNVLEQFDCSNNNLSLTTLAPLVNIGSEFIYAPQNLVTIPTQAPGVNLSDEYVVIDGEETIYTWKMAEDNSVVSEADIKSVKGICDFVNPDLGEVYCVISHPAFPEFTGDNSLKTNVIKTAGKPDRLIAKFKTPVGGQTASLAFRAARPGSEIYIDWEGSHVVFDPYKLSPDLCIFEAITHEDAEVSVWTYGNSTDVTVFSISDITMDYFDGSGLDKIITLTLSGAQLSEDNITFPYKENLTELTLDENRITKLDPNEYPNLRTLALSGNLLTEISIDNCPNMQLLAIAFNRLEKIDLNLPKLWFLDLAVNNLTEIDLSGVPDLEQLSLDNNQLSSIDLTPVPALRALVLSYNNFTLTTLPQPKAGFYTYRYNNQTPIDATCVDGKVDLSSQATVGSTATEYRWFIGVPELDEEGVLTGEELYVDDEYTIDNGVTTFLSDPGDEVMCVMTNSVFPDAYFTTNLMTVTLSGIETVIADLGATVSVENGTIYIKADVADSTAVTLYDMSGKKVAVTEILSGAATVSNVQPGIYVLSIGNGSVKVAVK